MEIEANKAGDSASAVPEHSDSQEEMITDTPTASIEDDKCSGKSSRYDNDCVEMSGKNESTSNTLKSANEIRERMLDHLASKTDIYFKSQQLGEPDLSFLEKRAVAEKVLNQSQSTFLSRFGNNILVEHLVFFANPNDEESYEVQYYVNKLRSNECKTITEVQIKNRRFEAMKRLMSEGEYFSVGEMRKRNPLLFDQLLGHFLPDPESKIADDQEHAVAHILLEQIEQDRVEALKKKQMEIELEQSKENPDSSDEDSKVKFEESLASKRMKENLVLWGKSYKGNHTIGKTRWKNKHTKPRSLINKCTLSHEEKVLLINEFTSSMFNSFLQGKDEFDYSEVDGNPDYDDVNQCDADEEEKYFDSESPEEKKTNINENEDDDELDKFMQNIESEVTSENLSSSFQRMNADNDKDTIT